SASHGTTDVLDYGELLEKYNNVVYRNDNELAPQHPCTVLISAGTGQGKTYLLLNLLTQDNLKMTYDIVYLCCPSLDEPAYQFLKDHLQKQREPVLEKIKKKNRSNKLTI